jgi:hypothetical protein
VIEVVENRVDGRTLVPRDEKRHGENADDAAGIRDCPDLLVGFRPGDLAQCACAGVVGIDGTAGVSARIERRQPATVADVDENPQGFAVADHLEPEARESRVDALGATDAHVIHAIVGQHERAQAPPVRVVDLTQIAGNGVDRLPVTVTGDDLVDFRLADLGRPGDVPEPGKRLAGLAQVLLLLGPLAAAAPVVHRDGVGSAGQAGERVPFADERTAARDGDLVGPEFHRGVALEALGQPRDERIELAAKVLGVVLEDSGAADLLLQPVEDDAFPVKRASPGFLLPSQSEIVSCGKGFVGHDTD